MLKENIFLLIFVFIILPGLKTVDQPLESQLQQQVTLNCILS